MSVPRLKTIEDLLALGSDAWFELVDGEFRQISPSFGKQSEIALNLVEILRPFIREHRLGRLTGERGGYVLSKDPDTVVSPDVGFVRLGLVPGGFPKGQFVPFPPDLAVEVMSPIDSLRDVAARAERYLSAGTRLVWVVQPDQRAVTVYRGNQPPVRLQAQDTLDGHDVLPGFSMPVKAVFADPME